MQVSNNALVEDFTYHKLSRTFERNWGMTLDDYFFHSAHSASPLPREQEDEAVLIEAYLIGHMTVDWIDGDPAWTLTPAGEAAMWRGEMTGIPSDEQKVQ